MVTLVRAPTRMEGDVAKADVSEAVDVLAKKYLNVKFVEIRAEDAVPPSRYETLPSIFVYQVCLARCLRPPRPSPMA